MASRPLYPDEIARKLKYASVYDDDREASTNAYWDLEDQIMFPREEYFLTAREEYPSPNSALKLDRTVSRFTTDGQQAFQVVAGEDKRKGAPKKEIQKAEDDVQTKALELMRHKGLSSLYCHTTTGTAFRTWQITIHSRCLEPLFGTEARGEKSDYIDIRTTFGQFEWCRLGSLVKNKPVCPLEDFKVLDYLEAPPEWMTKIENQQAQLEEQYEREQYEREQYEREQYEREQYEREQYEREQYEREQQDEQPQTTFQQPIQSSQVSQPEIADVAVGEGGSGDVAQGQAISGTRVHIHREGKKFYFHDKRNKKVYTKKDDWKPETQNVQGQSLIYFRHKARDSYWCKEKEWKK